MSAWSYQTPVALSDEQYLRWQSMLEQKTGICFLQHRSILEKGLRQRMREIGIDDFELYYDRVNSVPAGIIEWIQLVDRIAVKETSFFREPRSFETVKDFLTTQLRSSQSPKQLALWSVGCASGEEAYSLAMLTQDVIDDTGAQVYFGVTATDISRTALEAAKSGVYKRRKLSQLDPAKVHKYFVPSTLPGSAKVIPSLRQRLCFVQGNIIEQDQLPKMAMDVIYCQNVLIYFRRQRLADVLEALVAKLKPGGLLVLGPGEVVHWQHPLLRRTKDETVNAYQKLQRR